MVKGTLEPKWNYEQVVTIDSVTPDDIDLFENGAVNIYMYAEQVDAKVPRAREKLTTKELKEQQGASAGMPNVLARKQTQKDNSSSQSTHG